jgi:uncharacterized protein YbaP (TraB family)
LKKTLKFLTLAGRALAKVAVSSGPTLWCLKRSSAKTYIFGFADAKDRSWFSPTVESAFRESDEVWFETPKTEPSAAPPGNAAPDPAPANGSQKEPPPLNDLSPLDKELGFDSQGSLFDVLGPRVGNRTLEIAGIRNSAGKVGALTPMARFFRDQQTAFRQRNMYQPEGEDPDWELAKMAFEAHKRIRSEYPTGDDTTRFFANLSNQAQREHMEDLLDYIDDEKAGRNMEDLLDYIDDEKAGRNKVNYGWISGHPDTRKIERMRRRRPALYKAMHVKRNQDWANRISGFLTGGGVYFVMIGMNHILGPDSILHCLERIGLTPRRLRAKISLLQLEQFQNDCIPRTRDVL